MPNSPSVARSTATSLVSLICVLALLHFGREVLEPIVLASILSLIIAPLIRSLRRLGMGRVTATFSAVIFIGAGIIGIGAVLTSQLVSVTTEIPQYRAAIQSKLAMVRQITERPFAHIEAEMKAVSSNSFPSADPAMQNERTLPSGQNLPIPVEIRTPQPTTTETITRLLSSISGPVGEAFLVLVLLIFILLDHESLRDRAIRLTGQSEVGRTIKALGDATEGVSRFFFSQFLVNTAFAIIVALALWAAGVPHAFLFGALSGLLRFIPYLGALIAGGMITLFVAAIDPGWTLAIVCMAFFGAIEVLVANWVEPKVYGHSSGLSPLAVMVSALFWGALWGPIGLLLSTPLTLCLVVAGRHVSALEPITILFADTPNVDEAHRFFHRLLAADTDAIVTDAQVFLRKFSFAKYCDHILIPGLSLGAHDFENGLLEKTQQNKIRTTIATLAETVSQASYGDDKNRKRRAVSMLDANVGAHLRQMRKKRLGRWQGSLNVPSRSVVLCAGFDSERDDLLSELFVMALREVNIDARSFSFGDHHEDPGEDGANIVSTVFITYPLASTLADWIPIVNELRSNLPHALIVTIRLLSEDNLAEQSAVNKHVDMVLRSFEEGLAFVAPDRVPLH
ncbi:AI-2E family transporter [Undibacterium sp. 14-3-2]|uniref:AI-2E family transporter n=1 Tax=Undibacterium sp. 14-3-2 TaxID=2800129 RepID=UPI00190563B2|nr:AI-2E family transporter [Undibacterium sp. 14-3-2]MBK1889335.1 AI-2E family transporter [Undibacterium sp. 14-3-2]